MTRNCKHRYEFGRATVIVKGKSFGAAVVLDGIVPLYFRTEVHPADGSPVVSREVLAFYPWDAANKALEIYKATQK